MISIITDNKSAHKKDSAQSLSVKDVYLQTHVGISFADHVPSA